MNRSETHARTRHRAASEPSALMPECQWHDSAKAAYAKRSPAPSEWVERVERLTWGRAGYAKDRTPSVTCSHCQTLSNAAAHAASRWRSSGSP